MLANAPAARPTETTAPVVRAMINLKDFEAGDECRIDIEQAPDVPLEVSDVGTEDLGITEVVAVGLTDDSDGYALKWATHSDTATFVVLEDGEEIPVESVDIELVKDE